jgi:hypothetical protein
MWEGTLVYNSESGSIAELLDAGAAILHSRKVKDSNRKKVVAVRFTGETMQKLKRLSNTYVWVGKWKPMIG